MRPDGLLELSLCHPERSEELVLSEAEGNPDLTSFQLGCCVPRRFLPASPALRERPRLRRG